ncbi:MAG: DNA polymerase I [Alphaproteobacteria bacterium]|nr:DNA polymerase I [Alphaproteobacteria bacterium]
MNDSRDTVAPRHVYLVDGSGFIFRAFYSLPPLTRSDGTPVNAVLGYCNMIHKLERESDCDALVVLFDTARATFRNDIYPDYKANREAPPEELIPQFSLIREATRAFGLPSVEMAGYEADDLIATYARQATARGDRVTIVSSDKDLMQLVGDGVDMVDPKTMAPIGPDQVAAKFGVPPGKVVDVQALAGDSVDNVPGVPGIGIKTAAQLINDYGDLDALLARAGEITQPKRRQNLLDHADQARLSRDLVRLKNDVPVAEPLESFGPAAPDHAVLRGFLLAQEFKSLLARVEAEAGLEPTAPAAAAPAPAPATTEYVLVQTIAELRVWVDDARAAGKVAFDTETTSLDAMRADLVGFSLAIEPGRACYVPFGHSPAEGGLLESAPEQIPLAEALAVLAPMLADPSVLKVGQNLKYDMLVLARPPYDLRIAPIDDTMLMSFVLDAGGRGHGMDDLAQKHLDIKPISYKEVVGSGRAQITFDRVALERARDYAAEDADITLRLDGVLKPRLLAEHMVTVYETLERPLAPVLVAMERAGITVDRAALARLSQDFGERMAALEAEIHGLAGRPFAVSSPKQLGEVLFDEMSLPGGKKGKTGAYATGADILEDLAALGHDLPARVLDWRQLAKLKSTYSDTLVAQINPDTGRVHTSYAMAGAATGRLASTDPNLQNIPVRTEEGRKIRRAFTAPPGTKLMSADYSQIELRLLAEVAEIAPLRQAFADGADIHAMTAAQVFGVSADRMDPLVRRNAKAINFGIIYGQSAFGLARQLGIPQREAKRYIEAYFERYPGIRDYMDRTKSFARAHGYVATLFGRRCHLAGIHDKNPARRNYAERQAINAPLQGAAADIIKRAMIRMQPALDAAGLSAKMLLQVHDELIFEVPEAEVTETAQMVTRVMAAAPLPARALTIPLVVDTGIGDNWDEAH